MQKFKKLNLFLAAGFMSLALAVAPAAAANITVSDLSSNGWTKTYERDGAKAEISSEYNAPEGFGDESLVLKTPESNSKAQVLRTVGEVTLLSNMTSSYWAYRSSDSADNVVAGQAPALNIEVDVNGLDAEGGFTTLVFEPIYQTGGAEAVVENQWQEWIADDASIWWSSNSIPGANTRDDQVTLESIKAENPSAVVLRYGLNQGGGNQGLVGAVDGFTFNGATFDFNSVPEPDYVDNKDECKNGGWKAGLNADTNFKNQGDCVSHFEKNENAKDNPVVRFFKSIFSR